MWLFVASGTQWRRAGMTGIATGLDYAGVEAAARARGVPWTAQLLEKIRAMERAAIEVFADG